MDKIQIIEKLFYYIVAYSYLIIPLFFFFTLKRYHGKIPLILAIYGILFCAMLLIYWELPREFRKYHQTIYTFLEYLVFAYIFWFNIKNKTVQSFIVIASILFAIFQATYMVTSKFLRLDSMSVGIETILIFLYVVYFFYEFSKNVSNSYIYNHYCFWISVGIFIYLGGSFFFYISVNHLTDENQIDTFGNLTYSAEIIKNILFAVAILVYTKQLRETPKKQNSVPYLDLI